MPIRRCDGGAEWRLALSPFLLAVAASNDHPIARLGRFLRRYNIDELTQLWNVLKGEMSSVGLRPGLTQYVQPYATDYEKVLRVRPEMAGLGVVAFCNEEELLIWYPDLAEVCAREILLKKMRFYCRLWGT